MIIVSDLDGTLLDHSSYSYAAARPALNELQRRNIPLILNTSKTRAELADILADIGLRTPYIVENGSAIYSADHDLISTLGASRTALISVLAAARQAGFSFTAYSDMNTSDLVEHTGLTQIQAEQSLQREYTEPLLWRDSEQALESFRHFVQAQNLQCVQGGRFLHIMGNCDKGMAMRELIQRCYPHTSGPVVALGDSENDRAMLEQADIAVVVRSARHEPLKISGQGRVIITEATGPQGWCDAILAILAG